MEKSEELKVVSKQQDPLEKDNMVGHFSSTYTISKAIANFLPDIYEECFFENRYTFKAGSSSGGLVVYDEKFAFSHHGTDPASGRTL